MKQYSGFDAIAAGYKGVEDRAAFSDKGAVDRYRRLLRHHSAEQIAFLASRLTHGCRVLEVGSGNGRILIELARRVDLGDALGLDLATSRIAFARAWAADEGLEQVRFEAANALEHPLPDHGFDAAICITGAFAYFDATLSGSDRTLLERLSRTLNPGGLLVLELYPHHRFRRMLDAGEGELRIWSELPADDPWRFYLSRLSMQGDVLTHSKTFVHRTTGEIDDGRKERLRLYSVPDLRELLDEYGFVDQRFRAGWSDREYDGEEVLVVTATST